MIVTGTSDAVRIGRRRLRKNGVNIYSLVKRVNEQGEEEVKMELETIINILREIVFWSGVLSFITGIVLLGYRKYDILETKLAKEVGGIKFKIFPKLESNIYTYHERIMKRRKLLGLICIAYSLVATFVLRYFVYF